MKMLKFPQAKGIAATTGDAHETSLLAVQANQNKLIARKSSILSNNEKGRNMRLTKSKAANHGRVESMLRSHDSLHPTCN